MKEAESNIGKKEYDANDGLVRHSDATKIQVRPVCVIPRSAQCYHMVGSRLAGQECGCQNLDVQRFYPMNCTQKSSARMTYSMTLTGLYRTTHKSDKLHGGGAVP